MPLEIIQNVLSIPVPNKVLKCDIISSIGLDPDYSKSNMLPVNKITLPCHTKYTVWFENTQKSCFLWSTKMLV